MRLASPGSTIAVWFSCGAASAVAAYWTRWIYKDRCHVRILNTPVAEEDPDNLRFRADVEKWLGHPVETVVADKFPDSSAATVWTYKQAMSFPKGAPCTTELKKRARQEWEQRVGADYMVLGFTADEVGRHDALAKSDPQPILPVLIDIGWTKEDCYNFLVREGVKPPRMYDLGYPNANCVGCVKATSPTYWNLVRRQHPTVFEARAQQSRELGVKLVRVKGVRRFLDELDPKARGNKLKSMPECSLFCATEDK